jgi:hypothetical protein
MARLRVRVELSRSGAGVPLHKLASVVEEARKFFLMLGEDVAIDPARGEWLGFDFDHEAHFTAEYVGPVTAAQVDAFYAAFDGTTSLRRSTIAQFAQITEAIGEDELIGFGLFEAGAPDNVEPSEWRCLSRRDALRISDEIQVLTSASREDAAPNGDAPHDSHLPAVSDSGASLFRRAPREHDSDLAERLARIESKVDLHSRLIGDLRTQSEATEQSFRNLLGAVESFCDQAARQIERVAPEAIVAPAPKPGLAGFPNWLIAVIAGVVLIVVIVLSWLLWPAHAPEPVTAKASSPPPIAAPVTPPAAAPVAPAVAAPQPVKRPAAMKIEIDSTEPAWISMADAGGQRLAVGIVEPGKARVIDIDRPAWLRTGNAGGLTVKLNGKPLGPIGPHGKVREIRFKDGNFTITSPEPPVVH